MTTPGRLAAASRGGSEPDREARIGLGCFDGERAPLAAARPVPQGMGMSRRVALMGLAAPLAGCGTGALQGFASFDAARRAIAALPSRAAKTVSGWGLPQVLQHAAQSIDYSIDGYPQMKSGLFRGTVGAAAWRVFDARGAMRHALDEPIPGAPGLDAALTLQQAVDQLLAALQRFETHTGALQPHFAYGVLDKPAYTRAHLMHLANHWSLVQPGASA